MLCAPPQTIVSPNVFEGGRRWRSWMRHRNVAGSIPDGVTGISHWLNPSGGPGSVVGIATGYGLDGPWIEARGARFSEPVQTGRGPTQPPLQWVPGLSRE